MTDYNYKQRPQTDEYRRNYERIFGGKCVGKKLYVTRDVSAEECPWLAGPISAGTVVYRFMGPAYGCISANGVAVSLADGEWPAFELPSDSLGNFQPTVLSRE